MGTTNYSPATEGLEWMRRRDCRDRRPDEFFVAAGSMIHADTLAVCLGCPVRRECTTYAYQLDFASGYYGGFSPGDRRSLSLTEALERIDANEAGISTEDYKALLAAGVTHREALDVADADITTADYLAARLNLLTHQDALDSAGHLAEGIDSTE